MAKKQHHNGLEAIDAAIRDFGLSPTANAVMMQQLEIVRECLRDKAELGEDAAYEKRTEKKQFQEWYKAELDVGMLGQAIRHLRGSQDQQLKKYLKVLLEGDISQGGTPQQARDWFYELHLAGTLVTAGFSVELREPDLVVTNIGLSQSIGIACKYPSSSKGVQGHISKGLSQLKKHGYQGFVAVGIDQLVVDTAELTGFVDFDGASGECIAIMQRHADTELRRLVRDRPEKFPSEDPIDRLLVTLSLVGYGGTPARLLNATVLSMCCAKDDSLRPDIELLAKALQHLPSEIAECTLPNVPPA